MTVDFSLLPDAERALRERAAKDGLDIGLCAARILEQAFRRQSLDEMLLPLRRHFSEHGFSDVELGDDLEREKHALRDKKRPRPTS